MPIIESQPVPIDDDVAGLEWAVTDIDALAALIAVIALGQAEHAAQIIIEFESVAPAYTEVDLAEDAKLQMGISGNTDDQRRAARHRRDGFLFECMSWIVARQNGGRRTFLKDPHLDPTTHGLDGLILQLAPAAPEIVRAIICEDKCTDYPRDKFRDDVLRTFREHHNNKRARDLVANAVELIRDSGIRGTAGVNAAARVTDKSIRCYRAALTTRTLTTAGRISLFAGYDGLEDLNQDQRVGATLPLSIPLRDWFQTLADAVIEALGTFIDEVGTEGGDV
ncbi:hypothetical protein [Sphingosinicella sp.]|uniref:hypothetical protein n=1 Tax=Sphingosinicella sp. TaxID=1917971 RepID=UPI004037EB89